MKNEGEPKLDHPFDVLLKVLGRDRVIKAIEDGKRIRRIIHALDQKDSELRSKYQKNNGKEN